MSIEKCKTLYDAWRKEDEQLCIMLNSFHEKCVRQDFVTKVRSLKLLTNESKFLQKIVPPKNEETLIPLWLSECEEIFSRLEANELTELWTKYFKKDDIDSYIFEEVKRVTRLRKELAERLSSSNIDLSAMPELILPDVFPTIKYSAELNCYKWQEEDNSNEQDLSKKLCNVSKEMEVKPNKDAEKFSCCFCSTDLCPMPELIFPDNFTIKCLAKRNSYKQKREENSIEQDSSKKLGEVIPKKDETLSCCSTDLSAMPELILPYVFPTIKYSANKRKLEEDNSNEQDSSKKLCNVSKEMEVKPKKDEDSELDEEDEEEDEPDEEESEEEIGLAYLQKSKIDEESEGDDYSPDEKESDVEIDDSDEESPARGEKRKLESDE